MRTDTASRFAFILSALWRGGIQKIKRSCSTSKHDDSFTDTSDGRGSEVRFRMFSLACYHSTENSYFHIQKMRYKVFKNGNAEILYWNIQRLAHAIHSFAFSLLNIHDYSTPLAVSLFRPYS